MALTVPSYPDPDVPGSTIPNAYAWIAGIAFDSTNGSGRVTVWVHRSAAAAYAVPIGRPVATFGVALGETLVPAVAANPSATPPVVAVPAVVFPMLTQIVTEAAEYQQSNAVDPMTAIQSVLETHLMQSPRLPNAITYVPAS